MAKSLSCKDAGKDCGWSATAETEDELLAKATEHVKDSHPELQVSEELATKIKSLIKEV